MRFARSALRVLFVCIHAPHSASPERDVWWADLFQLLRRLAQDALLVLIGDYNLHLHYGHAQAIGGLVWGTNNPDPPLSFYRLLDHFALWVPSTYESCHPGDSTTWCPPGGAGTARIDYIAIPQSWQVPYGGSAVNACLDWGQSRIDHIPVQLWIHGFAPAASSKPRTGVRLHTAAMRTPEGRATLRSICRDLPLQPRRMDVHRHAQAIDVYFRGRLAAAFPAPRAPCRKDYFSPSTWQLRGKREWLRKRVRGCTKYTTQWQLRVAHIAWRTRRTYQTTFAADFAGILRVIRDLPVFLADLRQSSRELRNAIRGDSLQQVHAVAAAAVSSSTKSVVQRLRMLTGGPRRKQKGEQPLPAVQTRTGELAATAEEAKKCWLEHFSSIEDGSVRDPTDLVLSCIRRQEQRFLHDYHLTREEAPPLGSLEWALRSTTTDRAYGLDGLPGEVLHYCAAELATAHPRRTHPTQGWNSSLRLQAQRPSTALLLV